MYKLKIRSYEKSTPITDFMFDLNLSDRTGIEYSKNTKEKFVVYLDPENYLNDAWHFSNFDKDFQVYITSRYFKRKSIEWDEDKNIRF